MPALAAFAGEKAWPARSSRPPGAGRVGFVDIAAVLAALDDDIRRGAEDRVTTTVEDVTGRPARSFREFLS